jgi:hypothetical protein
MYMHMCVLCMSICVCIYVLVYRYICPYSKSNVMPATEKVGLLTSWQHWDSLSCVPWSKVAKASRHCYCPT